MGNIYGVIKCVDYFYVDTCIVEKWCFTGSRNWHGH